ISGGGDAFVAGLVRGLLAGSGAETAGWWAPAAAALTVARLGGRPDLDVERVAARADRAAQGRHAAAPRPPRARRRRAGRVPDSMRPGTAPAPAEGERV